MSASFLLWAACHRENTACSLGSLCLSQTTLNEMLVPGHSPYCLQSLGTLRRNLPICGISDLEGTLKVNQSIHPLSSR